MHIYEKREHPLGTVYLLQNTEGLLFEAYFSGDYTQPNDALRATRYGDIGKISIHEKAIVKLSVMSGCPYRCKPCDAGNKGFFGHASVGDIQDQFRTVVEDQGLATCHKLKLHISKLGEPALNWPNSFAAIQHIIALYPNLSIIPTVSTLPRRRNQLLALSNDLMSLDHPIKQLKINIGASDEARRQHLFGKCLSLGEIYATLQQAWANQQGQQRITLTLLAVDGEDIDVDYFLSAIPEHRDKFTIELYKVNTTVSALHNGLGNTLPKYRDASRFSESMNQLEEHGFFTYFSAPSNGEQTAFVANGSSLLQFVDLTNRAVA